MYKLAFLEKTVSEPFLGLAVTPITVNWQNMAIVPCIEELVPDVCMDTSLHDKSQYPYCKSREESCDYLPDDEAIMQAGQSVLTPTEMLVQDQFKCGVASSTSNANCTKRLWQNSVSRSLTVVGVEDYNVRFTRTFRNAVTERTLTELKESISFLQFKNGSLLQMGTPDGTNVPGQFCGDCTQSFCCATGHYDIISMRLLLEAAGLPRTLSDVQRRTGASFSVSLQETTMDPYLFWRPPVGPVIKRTYVIEAMHNQHVHHVKGFVKDNYLPSSPLTRTGLHTERRHIEYVGLRFFITTCAEAQRFSLLNLFTVLVDNFVMFTVCKSLVGLIVVPIYHRIKNLRYLSYYYELYAVSESSEADPDMKRMFDGGLDEKVGVSPEEVAVLDALATEKRCEKWKFELQESGDLQEDKEDHYHGDSEEDSEGCGCLLP